jgi:predicted transcriptional regulator
MHNRIIEATPYDEWVLASEIAEKIGISNMKVSHQIKEYLLYTEIERKPIPGRNLRTFLYRRIKRIKSNFNMAKVNEVEDA